MIQLTPEQQQAYKEAIRPYAVMAVDTANDWIKAGKFVITSKKMYEDLVDRLLGIILEDLKTLSLNDPELRAKIKEEVEKCQQLKSHT
jgi:hypothetical protein